MCKSISLFSQKINFHDYFVMAPLKPTFRLYDELLTVANFHDYFVMAPLKPGALAEFVREGADFHDYFVMAPLKRLFLY